MQIIDKLSNMVSVCDVVQLSEKTVLHSSFLELLGVLEGTLIIAGSGTSVPAAEEVLAEKEVLLLPPDTEVSLSAPHTAVLLRLSFLPAPGSASPAGWPGLPPAGWSGLPPASFPFS